MLASGNSGQPRDCRGSAGSICTRCGLAMTGCGVFGMPGNAALEIGKASVRLAARGEHGLQGFLAFVQLFPGIGQCLIQSCDLGFEIDLAGNAGLCQVIALRRDSEADLLVERVQVFDDFVPAALDAIFLGARLAEIGAGLIRRCVDFADRLFDDGDLVDAFRLVDRRIRDARDQTAHT